MSQIPLFAGGNETILADDARGRIVYTTALVPGERAAAWFAELRDAVKWQAQRCTRSAA